MADRGVSRTIPVTAGRAPWVDATAALTRELGRAPILTSDPAGWRAMCLRRWQREQIDVDYQPFGELLLVLQSGGRSWRVCAEGSWDRGQSVPGCVTIVPPQTPLHFEVTGAIDGWTLHLPPDRFENLLDDADPARLPERIRFDFASRDPLLTAAMAALICELQSPTERGGLYADRLADAITLHLLRSEPVARHAAADGGLSRRTLTRVLERIEHAIAEGVTLEALAALAGLSRSHFTSCFRRSTGTSPRDFLRRRRIERAKSLLRGSNQSIADVAIATGFSSQAHFANSFKLATGVTPRRYRRELGIGEADAV